MIDRWYHRPNYEGIYDAVAKIAFTTLARTVRGIQKNPNRDITKRKQILILQISRGSIIAQYKGKLTELLEKVISLSEEKLEDMDTISYSSQPSDSTGAITGNIAETAVVYNITSRGNI